MMDAIVARRSLVLRQPHCAARRMTISPAAAIRPVLSPANALA